MCLCVCVGVRVCERARVHARTHEGQTASKDLYESFEISNNLKNFF